MITFEEFKKIDLRVAKIIEAEKVPNSQNLLKLRVDLGQETRQIIAGIQQFYQPEGLIGKEVIVVVNLESKSFLGLESQGMILAADDNGPVLLTPEKEVLPGAKIR